MWEALTDRFEEAYTAESPVVAFLSEYDSEFHDYVVLFYNDLMTIVGSGVSENQLANMAFLHMGDAFKRIFDVLRLQYDPLENFFTDGTFTKNGKETLEKKGTEKTTPHGSIKREHKGQSSSESDGSFSVGQGTTYDSATTTPPATDETANDFYNINRNIQHNKTKSVLGDGSGQNLPTETTSYENHHVDKEFTNRKDERSFEDYKEETKKSGNSGIFSKQDLVQRELKLRLKNRIVPIYVRMVVDTFSSGVWSE